MPGREVVLGQRQSIGKANGAFYPRTAVGKTTVVTEIAELEVNAGGLIHTNDWDLTIGKTMQVDKYGRVDLDSLGELENKGDGAGENAKLKPLRYLLYNQPRNPLCKGLRNPQCHKPTMIFICTHDNIFAGHPGPVA